MLRVLGASRRQILAMQLAEYGMLAMLLALVALALGVPLGWLVVTRLFEFDWLPDWGQILAVLALGVALVVARSEEHTSELQSLMRISYAVFCLKKKKKT